MAGMILAVNVDKKPMLSLVAKAIDSLFHEPKDMFWTGRVMDMLFDGIPIDCTSTDFNAQAVCSVFDSGDINAIRKVEDGKFMFSLFAGVSQHLLLCDWMYGFKLFSHSLGEWN